MIRPVKDFTVFNTISRLEQTRKTIASARIIPDSYLVLVDGGILTEEELKELSDLVDYFWQTDVRSLPKSPGESTILYNYFTSVHFNTVKDRCTTVSKLSGRYWLDNCPWNTFPLDKVIIGFIPVAWMGLPLYKTRFYRIPIQYVEHFISHLKTYRESNEFKSAWPDIEHCFYKFDIVPREHVYSPERIGVCGFITGTNEFVQD